MPSDTFWTTQGLTPARALFQQTPGDLQGNPIRLLPGIDPSGLRDPALALGDATIYPRFDGVNVLVPQRPADFAAPTAASFAGWHAFHQIEYLREHGTVSTLTDGDGPLTTTSASLGTNPQTFLNLHVVLSSDGLRAIVINHLSATDLAALPLADQRAVAAHPVFRAEFAVPMGLLPNTTTISAATARAQMRALVQERIDTIELAPSFDPGRQADFDADPAVRGDLYHYLFTGQLRMLMDRLDAMAIFNPDMIKAEADAILTRFTRLERFMTYSAEGLDNASGLPTGVNATDGGASIVAAQNVLKGTEITLFDLARAARQVALTGSYEGRRVDTPDMVFLFQTFQNYGNEAEAEAKSEELKQLQRLLEDYTAFQKMINATLQTFDPVKLADPDTVELKGLKGSNVLDATFNAQERRLLAMFDAGLTGAVANNTWNPVEVTRSLDRPVDTLLQFGSFLTINSKTFWDALARNIAEATKVLNQDSQIRMDEISNLNRQKNRNYDLATNTLNKMADMLRSIIN